MIYHERDQVFRSLSRTMILNPQLKIFNAIIPPISIPVVHGFLRKKVATHVLSHYQAMHIHMSTGICHRLAPSDIDSPITIWIIFYDPL